MRARIASQVRIYHNVPYDAVFKSILKAVRAESLRVNVSDANAGLILASYASTEKQSLFMNAVGEGYQPERGEVIELVINLDKVADRKTKTRLSLQRVQSYNLLGNHEGREIVDIAAYRGFYGKLHSLLAAKYPSLEVKIPVPPESRKRLPTS